MTVEVDRLARIERLLLAWQADRTGVELAPEVNESVEQDLEAIAREQREPDYEMRRE